MTELTPSQTVGPFFAYALPDPRLEDLVPVGTPGSFELTGTLYDAAGAPVPDGLVEIWQPDQSGALAGDSAPTASGFRGFGRCATDPQGRYRFRTVRPGALTDAAGEVQAPHIAVTIFARGLLNKLLTRIYLPTESGELPDIPLPADTLLARASEHGFIHDFHLGGEDETVFLAF